jgi:NADPH:quinone reductase-like Zn-dependent oxidoreductase
VLTAAASSCASLLGQWALAMGARSVSGIIRSPQHRARLEQAGIYPILDTDRALVEKVSQHSDLVFDAVGGELANTLLSVLPASSTLISYGLLSGRPLIQTRAARRCASFICGRRCRPQRGGVAGGVRRDLAAAADDHAAAGPAGGVERLAGGDCRRRPAGKRR